MPLAPDDLFILVWPLSTAERAEYLAKHPEIRSEVEQMLLEASQAEADNLFQSPIDLTDDFEATETFNVNDRAKLDSRPATLIEAEERRPPLIGRYQTEKTLGLGAFGSVYLAWDPFMERHVALKLSHDPITSEGQRDQILNEARRMDQISHKDIVNVYDVGFMTDNRAYLVLEAFEGKSLSSFIRTRRGNLTVAEAAEIMLPIARAMSFVHSKRVVHRDLKPGNILVSEINGQLKVKVTDFGLAIRDDVRHAEGEYAGTLPYMAPEQVKRQSHDLHDRTDVWALGVILYELLTGSRPFGSATPDELTDEILTNEPKLPRALCPNKGISEDLESLCLHCLEKDFKKRTTTAEDVARALKSHIKQATSQSRSINQYILALAIVGVIAIAAMPIISRLLPKRDQTNQIRRDDELPNWATPEVITWAPFNDLNESYGYSKEQEAFRFETSGPSLFSIEECQTDELIIQARLRIHGSEQVGQAGVFWGLGNVMEDDRIDLCCWTAHLGRFDNAGKQAIEINQLNIGPSGGKHRVLDTRPVVVMPLQGKRNVTAFDIRVQVSETQITQLSVNDIPYLDTPYELKAMLGRDWTKLKKTRVGVFGSRGTLSLEAFSTE